MKQHIKFLFFLCLIVISNKVYCSYLTNVPYKITQPNGVVIDCFITGDEFYHWLHDKDKFTIVKDEKTGYYCYAILQDEKLIASKYVVGIDNPKLNGLQPQINISCEQRNKLKSEYSLNSNLDELTVKKNISELSSTSNLKSLNSTSSRTINNIVVYVRFSDQFEFGSFQADYNSLYNDSSSGVKSVYNYFKEISYNQLFTTATFYPSNNGSDIVSYQDSHPRSYYCEYSSTNTIGYQGDDERNARESTLLMSALNYIKNDIPPSLVLDSDDDGFVDNVTFVVRGSMEFWNHLLWSHKDELVNPYTVTLNSKVVFEYNLLFEYSLDVSDLYSICHEFLHTLGAPDLYHYNEGSIGPVGPWDVMASSENPASPCAYLKWSYLNWISSIPEITESGHYTLNPITSSTNNCYKINSGVYGIQFFVLEFRQKLGIFESSNPGTGLLIYRINMREHGNSGGPPDEVYIYRPNGTLTVNGDINNANFDSNLGRSTFHESSNPNCFLSDGTMGKIYIKNIVVSDNTVSFDVRFCDHTNVAFWNTIELPSLTNASNLISTSESVVVQNTDNVIFEAGNEVFLNSGFEVQLGGEFEVNMNGCGEQY